MAENGYYLRMLEEPFKVQECTFSFHKRREIYKYVISCKKNYFALYFTFIKDQMTAKYKPTCKKSCKVTCV